jgi:hypothetical protein
MAVFVWATSTHDNAAGPQRLRVAEAVADLQACLTCHPSHIAAPALAAEPPALVLTLNHSDLILPRSFAVSQPLRHAPAQNRLLDMGRRLLALPDEQIAQAGPIIVGFLQVYEQVSTGHSAADPMVALDNLTDALNILENQAQAVQWRRANPGTSQTPAAAWLTTVSVSPGYTAAVIEHVRLSDDSARPTGTLPSADSVLAFDQWVSGVHRRGPPSDAYFYNRVV